LRAPHLKPSRRLVEANGLRQDWTIVVSLQLAVLPRLSLNGYADVAIFPNSGGLGLELANRHSRRRAGASLAGTSTDLLPHGSAIRAASCPLRRIGSAQRWLGPAIARASSGLQQIAATIPRIGGRRILLPRTPRSYRLAANAALRPWMKPLASARPVAADRSAQSSATSKAVPNRAKPGSAG
jgi:hypothetical protein